MRYWWVNQNQTFRQEIAGGYLWSPKRNANGSRNPISRQGREGFCRLEEELGRADVYGITIKLKQRELWEPDFVSVIDCRGDKACKENYTKWHEIGHLLILADNNRSSFRRTHCSADTQDPEEALVEVIAGKFAFWSEMIRSHISGPASFDLIEKIRQKVSPEASRQSALIGIVKAWPDHLLLCPSGTGTTQERRAGAPAKDLRV